MILLNIVGLYLLLGLLFSLVFLWKGLNRVDPTTKGSSFYFKLLIIPGMIVFWIFFLGRWIKNKRT
jgi:hypothetical protein